MQLEYHKGTILISGEYNIPNTRWDSRSGCYRGMALYYRDITKYLEESEIPFEDNVLKLIPCPELSSEIQLRGYQKEALDRWMKEKIGVIVLPTGSGKTVLALKIIEEINTPTFIVVPTLDLVEQWRKELKKLGDITIGEYTGTKKDLQAVTVSTYDSAYINAENLGNKFKLLIFDEVHHLPSKGYRQIAEMFASPYRLGLTATYEREDLLHKEMPRLIGGKVYEVEPHELSDKHLSRYELKKIITDLTPEEKARYTERAKTFRNYLISRNIRMRGPQDFQKVIMRSGIDPKAREAVLARNEAEKIAYNSESKLEEIRKILEKSRKRRTIIFTRYNEMVYRISNKFLIPCITYKTARKERSKILDKFKQGSYSAIATSQVLDEGVDVPEANLGIIVSGTGSSREFTQRLGRLLRPGENKKAILYELISRQTKEMGTAWRRKKQ